jgi:hypothetical protein
VRRSYVTQHLLTSMLPVFSFLTILVETTLR